MTRNFTTWLITALLASACSSHRFIHTALRETENNFKDHIGFELYDPAKKKVIIEHQSDRYFTPASNTKIFTLYASLLLLHDSVPSLRYIESNDSLIFWGTGNPGFLYQDTYQDNKIYDFLKNHPSALYFSSSNFDADYFGPGWGWDDYLYYYQVERTPFPIYGNLATVKKVGETFLAQPQVFDYTISKSPLIEKPRLIREVSANHLTYWRGKTSRPSQWNIPFHCSDSLFARLLSDTLKKRVTIIDRPLSTAAATFYSTLPDSLYRVMMQASDNFIAEQLLLVCANVVSDTLNPGHAIKFMKEKFLADLPDEPLWVDGSGLSRYNLFTPRSIVRLWEKIEEIVPRERVISLLAVGGESGTLKNYYKMDKPFVFGKTGTLSNNHALSGYLVTKKGRTFIFSWMNNNFASSTGDVRATMEVLLKKIYEKY